MSKETTPMQELIDKYNEKCLTNGFINWLNDNEERLLEKEKQMVVDAFDNGAQEADDWHSNPRGGSKTAEQYFNEKYGEK